MESKNELRVGNKIINNGMIDTVTGIFHEMSGDDSLYFIQAENKLDYFLENIEPIELTPDILLKCGAIKQLGEWEYLLRISALKMFFRFNAGKCYSELGGIYLGDRISQLHTLQNLYQPLTGTELEINLS